MRHGVADPELDPRVAVLAFGQRVGSLGKVVGRLEPEHVGEPARRGGRPGVGDTERQPGDVDLLVGHPVALRAPRAEPARHDTTPRGAALVLAAGGDEVLDGHAGAAVDRREAHLGLDVVERRSPRPAARPAPTA